MICLRGMGDGKRAQIWTKAFWFQNLFHPGKGLEYDVSEWI